MTDWIVRVHGREHRISDAEYQEIQNRLRIADDHPPLLYVGHLSGEDVRFPHDWKTSVEFVPVDQ